MRHDNEEWWKFWRRIDLSFQNWREEFDEFWSEHLKVSNKEFIKFWPEHSKVAKIFTLMSSFWAKYILFELKKYIGIIFHETEERYKIWRGIEFSFQNWLKEFDKIWPEHSKVSKMFILMSSFWAKYIFFELKMYRGIIFHETEEGNKIWRGIDFSFQNWHKEFDTPFEQSIYCLS